MSIVVVGEDDKLVREYRPGWNEHRLNGSAGNSDDDAVFERRDLDIEIPALASELPPALAVATLVEFQPIRLHALHDARERLRILCCAFRGPIAEINDPPRW